MSINGKQSVKLEEGIIELENYFKEISVPFKIYADFDCNLKGVKKAMKVLAKKIARSLPCSFPYKVVCVDHRFANPTVGYRGENGASEFIKAILKEYEYCRKVMNKHFNKNLIMSEEEEHLLEHLNKVAVVGFVKNLLIMMKKKLEIIVTRLVDLEAQLMGVVTQIFN